MKRNIIFLVIGIILSFGSFFAYLYPADKIWPLIIALGALDVIFLYFNAVILLDESDYKWLKAGGISVGYLALFNVCPIIYLLVTENMAKLSSMWLDVLMYSLFSGPMLIIVFILISIILIIQGWLNGHTV